MQQDYPGRDESLGSRAAMSNEVGSAGLGATLAVLLAIPVATFFWFAAYSPATLAGPIGAGGPASVWIVYGVGLIAYATLLNGLYVLLTNRRLSRQAGMLAVAALGVCVAVPARAAPEGSGGGGPNWEALSFFLVLVGGDPGDHLLGRAAHPLHARLLRRRRPAHSAAERAGAGGRHHLGRAPSWGCRGWCSPTASTGCCMRPGYAVAYPLIGILFADRMRNIGKFTFADVISFRLSPTPIRAFAATSTLVIAIFFLISQMVGAGTAGAAAVRDRLRVCRDRSGRADGLLRAVRRHDGHHLGADRQVRADAADRHGHRPADPVALRLELRGAAGACGRTASQARGDAGADQLRRLAAVHALAGAGDVRGQRRAAAPDHARLHGAGRAHGAERRCSPAFAASATSSR